MKDVFSILQSKRKITSLDITNVGSPHGSLVFINQVTHDSDLEKHFDIKKLLGDAED